MRLAIALAISLLLLGCTMVAPGGFIFTAGGSVVRTPFVDQDGTNFESLLVQAPFSKLDQKAAQMHYTWTAEGGTIAVGDVVQGLDHTAQVQVATVIADKAFRALALYYGWPLPALPPIPFPDNQPPGNGQPN